MLPDVLPVVQVDQHRGVPHDAQQNVAEVPGCPLTEHPILGQEHPIVAHLRLGRCEVPVPEERHLLLERPGRCHHAVGPPKRQAARLQDIRPQAVEELVHDWLDAPRLALRQDFLAQGSPVFPGNPDGLRPAGRERVHARIPEARFLELGKGRRIDRFVVDNPFNRAFRRHRRQLADLLRSRTESRPLDQVRCTVECPLPPADRPQVVDPARSLARTWSRKAECR